MSRLIDRGKDGHEQLDITSLFTWIKIDYQLLTSDYTVHYYNILISSLVTDLALSQNIINPNVVRYVCAIRKVSMYCISRQYYVDVYMQELNFPYVQSSSVHVSVYVEPCWTALSLRISAPHFFHRFVSFCRWVCHGCPGWLHRMRLWLAQPVVIIIVAFLTLHVVIWHQFRGHLLVEWYVSGYPVIPLLGCDHCTI